VVRENGPGGAFRLRRIRLIEPLDELDFHNFMRADTSS
jgi:hypothetical protein